MTTKFRIYLLAFAMIGIKGAAFSQGILDNTQLRFFTHTSFSNQDSVGHSKQPFEIGDMELLLTSQITDKLSFLGEVIHTPEGTVEIDRLMLKYQFNDYFHLSAGKLYVPIGLWNTTFYHQARVLSPTIDHPAIIADQADNGVLDNKDEGLQLGGENVSKLRLGYRLFFSNGFSAESKKPGITRVSYNVFIEPVDNLRFALSGQNEKIKAGATANVGILTEDVSMNLVNASVMFMGGTSKFEFASEYYLATQNSPSAGTKKFNAFFAYAGYKINKFTPYLSYNYIDYNPGMLIYPKNNFTGSVVGLRYRIAALSVLKFEAQFLQADSFNKLNNLELQLAIGF